MDPATRLDHAVFQLTPTRTRCDLVAFSADGEREKLASGLIEPFLSHLKAAEEQISKGGYSIKLHLPAGMESNGSWFTKATLERFVRFVKTPEILERVVTIEREISQIEDSIRTNELVLDNTDPSPKPISAKQTEDNGGVVDGNNRKVADPLKSKIESNMDDCENSKLQLLRVFETRKAVLRREQSMSYAQASAAGFEIDYIDDLISFSDVFGASRLREACKNFKDLYKRQHDAWLDELATANIISQAVIPCQGASRILVAGQGSLSHNGMHPSVIDDASQIVSTGLDANVNHDPSNRRQDYMTQLPSPALNTQPQFIYNIPNPVVPSTFPYPGYIMPTMQMIPPFYPGYAGSPQQQQQHENSSAAGTFPDADYGKHSMSYSTKQKAVDRGKHASSGSTLGSQDESSDQDDSGSDDEENVPFENEILSSKKSSSGRKSGTRKIGKKSSRVVVIRNINYVTSRKRRDAKDGEEDDWSSNEEFIDGDSLEQNVGDVVESLKRHHKVNHLNIKKKGEKHASADIKSSDDSVSASAEDGTIGHPAGEDNHDENWDSFRNLLMRIDESPTTKVMDHDYDKDSYNGKEQVMYVGNEQYMVRKAGEYTEGTGSITFQPETKGTAKKLVADGSFVVSERDVNPISTSPSENIESEVGSGRTVKLNKFVDEAPMLSERIISVNNGRTAISDYHQELSAVGRQIQKDMFMTMPERFLGNEKDSGFFVYDSFSVEKKLQNGKAEEKKLIDDSYIVVSSRTITDEQPQIQWKSNIYIDEGIPSETRVNGFSDHDLGKAGISTKYEPDDLFMVLDRKNETEPVRESWTPEINYSVETTEPVTNRAPSCPQTNGSTDGNTSGSCNAVSNKKKLRTKSSTKDAHPVAMRGYLHNSKSEIVPRKAKPLSKDAIQKAKKDKEEEERKRIEEQLVQRQQRIAQRSATGSSKAVKANQSISSSKSTKMTHADHRNQKELPNSSVAV